MAPDLLGRFPPKQNSQDLFLLPVPCPLACPSLSLPKGWSEGDEIGSAPALLLQEQVGSRWSKNLAVEQKPWLVWALAVNASFLIPLSQGRKNFKTVTPESRSHLFLPVSFDNLV